MRVRLVGGLLTAALLAGCATTEPSATTSRTEPAPAGEAPPAPACEHLPEEIVPAGVDALPPLTLPCLGPGPDVALDRLTGRPTLVNLWATWCAPCREEMPMLQDAHARHDEQVRFLGVDVQDDPDAARWFLDEHDIDYPHAVDAGGELLRELGMRGLPVTLALDPDGRVIDRVVGQLTSEDLQRLIDALLRSGGA
ncbi:TlpA family protein disulfide reductase [Modestobacter sp. VKM Ac-2984]|uniref:TlpA family protein disulfide reductase n=1 Tax=Modestobacter sp. VKM Ac-2984 TaxID=3004138 RepID=UPI0022AB0BC2|nr:TlpA disulfide reductase family protein [Modestobacter sp. VKM Ac-2984]MCZ2818003.1 TlpA disulfide reductase family protein [Modestobacter sp. VKM Ac-2984]